MPLPVTDAHMRSSEMYSPAPASEVRRGPSDRRPLSASNRPGRASIRGGIAEGHDGESIDRLATFSGGTAPQGAVLFAEVGGHPVAAIGIFDGKAVADPDRSSLS